MYGKDGREICSFAVSSAAVKSRKSGKIKKESMSASVRFT
jgi:hypothetical protein